MRLSGVCGRAVWLRDIPGRRQASARAKRTHVPGSPALPPSREQLSSLRAARTQQGRPQSLELLQILNAQNLGFAQTGDAQDGHQLISSLGLQSAWSCRVPACTPHPACPPLGSAHPPPALTRTRPTSMLAVGARAAVLGQGTAKEPRRGAKEPEQREPRSLQAGRADGVPRGGAQAGFPASGRRSCKLR